MHESQPSNRVVHSLEPYDEDEGSWSEEEDQLRGKKSEHFVFSSPFFAKDGRINDSRFQKGEDSD